MWKAWCYFRKKLVYASLFIVGWVVAYLLVTHSVDWVDWVSQDNSHKKSKVKRRRENIFVSVALLGKNYTIQWLHCCRWMTNNEDDHTERKRKIRRGEWRKDWSMPVYLFFCRCSTARQVVIPVLWWTHTCGTWGTWCDRLASTASRSYGRTCKPPDKWRGLKIICIYTAWKTLSRFLEV